MERWRVLMSRWQLPAREFWVWLALWLVGAVLVLHYGFHGGSDPTAFGVFVGCAVLAWMLVVGVRQLLIRWWPR